jgi:hypothetical protein
LAVGGSPTARPISRCAWATRVKLSEDFSKYGLELVDFFINAITPPEELQRAIDTLAAACNAYEPDAISAVFRSLLEGFEPPPPAGDPLGGAAP